MQDRRVQLLKVILLLSSLVCLVFLGLAAFEENFSAEWRAEQHRYSRKLSEQALAAKTTPVVYPVRMRQIYLKDWNRVDRCVTCHVGIDNPAFHDAPQPLTAHLGNLLTSHPPEKFGCTVCHAGQGRATQKDAAHGRVPFWDKPLLTGELVQASCTKCHRESPIPQAAVLSTGRSLIQTLGCLGCHQAGSLKETSKAGPRLTAIGSKVSRRWMENWLTNPRKVLPHAKMPDFHLRPVEVRALAAYLMTFHDKTIDSQPKPKGDYDAGAVVYKESQCIVCHVTKDDYAGRPVGGTIGPDLRKIGNKVHARWLLVFLKNPHSFVPHTKMPRYHLSDKDLRDLVTYMLEEWVDFDEADAEKELPALPPVTAAQIKTGRLLFTERGCAGCHDLTDKDVHPEAPDLTFVGSTPVHRLDFGTADVRHTLPDFFFSKLKSPRSLFRPLALPRGRNAVSVLWNSLRPAALFSASHSLPDGTDAERLAWILKQCRQSGLLDDKSELPSGPVAKQVRWLTETLNKAGLLNTLKMPDFQLSDTDAVAIAIALMSFSEEGPPSQRYVVPARPKVIFNPNDNFGALVRRYRCTSCHKLRDSGTLLASDLTYEGSRVNQSWLYHYLSNPYSMRRTLTIAMPTFHFPDADSRLMADYMAQVFVDRDIGIGWEQGRSKADVRHGAKLFTAKGCFACHQVNGKGGDVGPSLTTQVPEFPVGTWVGDKLRAEWIYEWLKNPQALLPETIEPNLNLSNQERLDLTAYLLSLKNPEFQPKTLKSTTDNKAGTK